MQVGVFFVQGVAHHRAAIRNSQHSLNGSEADRWCKGVEVVEPMYVCEAACNQPRLVFVEAPICIPLGDKDLLARKQIIAPRDKAPLKHTLRIHCY